jgi:hypothetical protein
VRWWGFGFPEGGGGGGKFGVWTQRQDKASFRPLSYIHTYKQPAHARTRSPLLLLLLLLLLLPVPSLRGRKRPARCVASLGVSRCGTMAPSNAC